MPEPVEIAAMLQELKIRFGRRGELFGLKWEDIDFPQSEIRVVRSVVDQVEGPPKTLVSPTTGADVGGIISGITVTME